jgi:hypothetical protein
MSARGTQFEPPPAKGIAKGEFFYREENPFHDVDDAKQPTIVEAEEELETNVFHLLSSANFIGCAI